MKKWIHAFAMCQSMFCAVPVPWNVWDEEARHRMLLFLPIIGLELGAVWVLLSRVCQWLGLPALVTGLILCAWPYLSTGFLHLDGFMDVTDAVKSCRSPERRREILKDPHVGSFAVIGVVLLILSQFALLASAEGNGRILLLIPVVSRCCSALAVSLLKPMSTSQYAARKRNMGGILWLSMILMAALGTGFWLCGRDGFALIGCLAGYALALRKGYKALDGMNGDISGYGLCIAELCAVAVYALI